MANKKLRFDEDSPLPERFELLAEIGRGAMSVVYRAFDHELEHEVAVKLLPEGARGGQMSERYHREGRELARINHPNVVGFYGEGVHKGRDYLILEYVSGGDLRRYISRPRVRNELLQLFLGICRGLAELHARGLVHRDLKPENVLIGDDGEARLTDLGLVRSLSSNTHLTSEGALVGTLSYLSPEQILSGELSAAADLYALGACLYEAMVGRPLFDGRTEFEILQRHVRDEPTPPRDIIPDLDLELEDLILRLVSKDPIQRPSADESARILAEYLLREARGEALPADWTPRRKLPEPEVVEEPPPPPPAPEEKPAVEPPAFELALPNHPLAKSHTHRKGLASAKTDVLGDSGRLPAVEGVGGVGAGEVGGVGSRQSTVDSRGDGEAPAGEGVAGAVEGVGEGVGAGVGGVDSRQSTVDRRGDGETPAGEPSLTESGKQRKLKLAEEPVGEPSLTDSGKQRKLKLAEEPVGEPSLTDGGMQREPAVEAKPSPPVVVSPPPVEPKPTPVVAEERPRVGRKSSRSLVLAGVAVVLLLVLGAGAMAVKSWQTLRVESVPSGATLTLDGQARGQTPQELSGLSFGDHQVELQLPGHKPFQQSVTIAPGRAPAPLHLELARLTRVKVTLDPPDLALLVDGEPAALQDGYLVLEPGEHTYNYSREGYLAAGEVVTVPPGDSEHAVKLEPITTAFLTVQTRPGDARILVDGKPYDPSQPLKAGSHQLVVRRKGFQESRQTVTIVAGQDRSLDVKLTRARAQLKITSDPVANVFLNGQSKGKTPLEIRGLQEGPVTLKLTAAGYVSLTRKLTLEAGANKRVSYQLEPVAPPPPPPPSYPPPSYPQPSYPPPYPSYPPPPPPGPAPTPDY